MKIKEVIAALEQFAPLPLQEDFDNAGLQVGLTEAEVSGALLCLDVTEQIVDEALKHRCNLIVSHHPLIFHKLKSLTGKTMVERCVMKAIKNDIVIASMHTNLDNAQGGVNHKMAQQMGLASVEFMSEKTVEGIACGSGVVGTLPQPMSSADFLAMLKERFGVECVQCNQPLQHKIERVAICGGAGAFLLDEALRLKVDAFVTGEMHYHEFFGHEQQIQIAVIGHYQSEQYTVSLLREIIESTCPGVRTIETEINTNPIHYV